MHFFIRPMELKDIAEVRELDEISFPNPWPAHSYEFEIKENNNSRCWVVVTGEEQETIVAMAVVWIIEDEAHIGTIAVHPAYRGIGLGEFFLSSILSDSYHAGARKGLLEVRQSNIVAQSLYSKFGFKKDGVRKRYYRDNGENAILMSGSLLDLNFSENKVFEFTTTDLSEEENFGSD